MKKIIIGILVSILISQAVYATMPFDDVPTDHWAYEDIQALYDRGVINGKSGHHFGLNDTTTVAEFTKMLMGVLNLEPKDHFIGAGDNPYIKFGDWYYDYITAATNLNFFAFPFNNRIIEYKPNEALTRMEAAGMMIMAMQPDELYRPITAGRFRDLKEDSVEMCYAIRLASYGIMNGYEEAYLPFKPNNLMTRAEAAVIINRIYKSFYAPEPLRDITRIKPGYGTIFETCETKREEQSEQNNNEVVDDGENKK